MASSQAARIHRRVIPMPHHPDDERRHLESILLYSPKPAGSSSSLLWDPTDDLVEGHETPMGACLLSPKCAGFPEWGGRRKVRWFSGDPPSSAAVKTEAPPTPPPAAVPALPAVKEEPSELSESSDLPSWQWTIAKKRSSQRKRKPSRKWEISHSNGKRSRISQERPARFKGTATRVDRWSAERYSSAEDKMVAIMKGLGARLGRPVMRQVLREEARRHIGDTGLLDHLLKHMAGKEVAGGVERFQRRHNADGDLEYWLEPAEMEEVRLKAGTRDPFWVPPPGWKPGDPLYSAPCGEECQKEMSRLRGEVAAMKRVNQNLLQWKSKLENESEDVDVSAHETPLGACLLPPKSGWGVQRKIKLIIRQPRDTSSSSDVTLDQQIEKGSSPDSKRTEEEKNLSCDREDNEWKSSNEDEQESMVMKGPKVDRWSAERYRKAGVKLVEIMRKLGAELEKPIVRQELREEVRKHIGDTGLLDHLLKHMVGKVVVGGNERLQRRHNTEGAMVYWLEPADLVEIRQKAGVTDPYWAPPPGWQLGDAASPWPCSVECKKEMSRLREEIAAHRREVEQLRALLQLEKQFKYTQSEDGEFPELIEMDEQGGRRDGWFLHLLAGRDSMDERIQKETQVSGAYDQRRLR